MNRHDITNQTNKSAYWQYSVIPVCLTINGMLLFKGVIIPSQIIPVKNAHHYNDFAIKVIKHLLYLPVWLRFV